MRWLTIGSAKLGCEGGGINGGGGGGYCGMRCYLNLEALFFAFVFNEIKKYRFYPMTI